MTTLFTDTYRIGNLVKKEQWPNLYWCREAVTVNESAAKVYAVGTVLGKVTATGKYKISVEDASDGSEVPAALVLGDHAIPATTDTSVLVMVRGCAIVSKDALVWDASWDNDTKIAAGITAFQALNPPIMVNDTVTGFLPSYP